MENDQMLAILEPAVRMLAEAKTIQETKNVLDVAVTAKAYARQKKLGAEAILYATAIEVEALKQLGNMLKETPRNTGGRPIELTGTKVLPVIIPALADMGLDKKTSKLAQDVASLPDETIEQVKKGDMTVHQAQKKVKEKERTEMRAEIARTGESIELSERWHIYHADINTWIAPQRYDFIITDPPYPKEFLPLYEVLAIRAKEWLKDGGLLIAMCGQSYLDEIYATMSKHLNYYWTASYLTPGQPTPLRQVNVNTTWKPLLIFSNGKYIGKIFGDVFTSDGNDKNFHMWGQSESGMGSIVEKMCLPGQSILDPFCGAGTTGIAAIRHGCLFTGIDNDEQCVNIAKARIYNDTKKVR